MRSASESINYFRDLKIASQNRRQLAVSIEDLCEALGALGIPGPRHFRFPGLSARGTRIGQGAQFDVFYDRLAGNELTVIKRVKPILCSSNDPALLTSQMVSVHLQTLKLEISSLGDDRRRHHSNIARLVEWGYDYPSLNYADRIPILVMERAKCTLLDFLQQTLLENEQDSLAVRHHICLDVAEALACVHSTGLAHGDIKPENILVFAHDNPHTPWIAKLSDFGSCIDLRSKYVSSKDYRGTYGWQPPEIADRSKISDEEETCSELFIKADSFAYGLLVVSVFTTSGRPLPIDGAEGSAIEVAMSLLTCCTFAFPVKMMLQRLCGAVLHLVPLQRPEVSSSLLSCDTESYKGWTLRNALSSPARNGTSSDVSSGLSRSNFEYWLAFDTIMLLQLNQRWDDISTSGRRHQFSAQTLFGMMLQYAMWRSPGHQYKVLKYAEAAAQVGSKPAQGITWQLYEALGEPRQRDSKRSQMLDWLQNAASDGSYVGLQKLQQLDPARAEQARRAFLAAGGYNSERAELSDPSSMAREMDALTSPNSIIDESANRLLHAAAVSADIGMIRRLIRMGADINANNAAGETPIYKACLAARSECVATLLELGADPKIRVGEFGISCLHWLFNFDDVQVNHVARLLIDHGSDPNVRLNDLTSHSHRRYVYQMHSPFHWPLGTPLHWACATSSFKAAAVLLEVGARINESSSEDETFLTPLMMSFYDGNATMAEFLIKRGADCTRVQSGKGTNCLHLMAQDYSVLNALFRSPRSLHGWVNHGSWDRHLQQVRHCIRIAVQAGVDINAHTHRHGMSSSPYTPALDAARDGHAGVLLALLQEGCNTDHTEDISGDGLFNYWAKSDSRLQPYPQAYVQVWRALMLRTSDPGPANAQGKLAQHMAVWAPYEKDFQFIIRLFVDHYGRDILELRDARGDTPLLIAVTNRAYDDGVPNAITRFQYLRRMGADMTARNFHGCDMILLLLHNPELSDQHCLMLIEERLKGLTIEKKREVISASASLSNSNKSGRHTALSKAAGHARLRAVTCLLDIGIDVNVCSDEGSTALDYALEQAQSSRQEWMFWLHFKLLDVQHQFAPLVPEDMLFARFGTANDQKRDTSPERPNGVDEYNREKYFHAPLVIRKLLAAGAKRAKEIIPNAREIYGPRTFDQDVRNMPGNEDMSNFRAEEQPFYEHWKILYELMPD